MIHKSICFCLLLLLYSVLCYANGGSKGVISGKWITKDMGPMIGAQVLLFNAASGPAPSSNKHLRIPDAGIAIDSEGRFSADVPAGKYYLVMRKRVNPESAGPPEEGDPQYYARLKNGQPKTFVVKSGKTTNIGTVTMAVPFKRAQPVFAAGFTGIEGTITDEDGVPVAGVRVLAYDSPKMEGRPLFASEGTGKDGKYLINVYKKGTYYLKVRSHYGGGQPKAGEFMGGYGEPTEPAIVKVDKGKIRKGIDIKTNRFPGRGSNE